MKRHALAILLIMGPASVGGGDVIAGKAVQFGKRPIPGGWVKADGRCLEDSQYPELADALHVGNSWPYGRCDDRHFKLPDLTGKNKRKRPHYILRSN